jgi:hypothetical protein
MHSFFLHFRRVTRASFAIILKDPLLFFGMAFFICGFLSFNHGRYCDGNVADYYACTNSAVYYYYGPISIIACVFGAFMIAVWKINQGEK